MARRLPILLALTVLVTGVFSTREAGRVRPAEASTKRVAAWIAEWDQPRGYQSFVDNADLYSDVSPFWYEMISPTKIGTFWNSEDPEVADGIRSRGVLLIPTISNMFDGTRVAKMLETASNRAAHVSTLLSLVKDKNYDGIDIDYEYLRAEDRDRFSAFVSELATAFRGAGKLLTVTVHPKTSEPGTWHGPQAQDYVALGAAADRLRVMAYDYHWSTSEAGPIAPLSWVDDVARFAASQVSPGKVQLGLPLYGYDWVGTNGEPITHDVAVARMDANGAKRQWSSSDAEPWFTYRSGGSDHEVWYQDGASVDARLQIVQSHGLAGPIFWRLGGEDPAVWTAVRNRFGSESVASADTTAPTAPSNLEASAGRRAITLSWTASSDSGGSGVAGYDIYRSSSSGGTYKKVGTTTGTKYKNGRLRRSTTYWYYVVAFDGAGNRSAASSKVSATTR